MPPKPKQYDEFDIFLFLIAGIPALFTIIICAIFKIIEFL